MNFLLSLIKKYALISILVLTCASFFYFHFYDYLSFATLREYQLAAQAWTITHYTTAVTLYIFVYILMIACAIPCATLLTLLGGFLFGGVAFVYAVFSTTVGGVVLFLAVRTSLGSNIAAKSTGWIKRLENAFQRNAFHYILMLRLVPVFPCWISNITAGVLNVPLKTFVGATVLGIIPATAIYVMVGRGLDKLLTDYTGSFLNILLTPSVFFPLLGLAILSIFPVVYKGMK